MCVCVCVSQVPDHEHPEFFKKLDYMVEMNKKIQQINEMNIPKPLKTILSAPFVERIVAECAQLFFLPPLRTGSVDIEPELKTSVVY